MLALLNYGLNANNYIDLKNVLFFYYVAVSNDRVIIIIDHLGFIITPSELFLMHLALVNRLLVSKYLFKYLNYTSSFLVALNIFVCLFYCI